LADQAFITITMDIPTEDVSQALLDAGYADSEENITTITEALGDKWMTDLTEVNEYDFIIEVMADDLEPDEGNVKGLRDWRMRQGAPPRG
jgi:hypothetical protein